MPIAVAQTSGAQLTMVRTVEMALGPFGWSSESYNYIMRHDTVGWVLSRRVVAGVFE
jgi:hypothetical protein